MNSLSLALPVALLTLLPILPAQDKVHDFKSLTPGGVTLGETPDSVANMGDLDGDGFDDIAAGARWSTSNPSGDGTVLVLSGRTGRVLGRLDGSDWRGYFGYCVKNLGDVDKDGVADIGVGALYSPHIGNNAGPGQVFVYSGKTRKLIWNITPGLVSGGEFGNSLAALGDLNGDGYADFAVGAPRENRYGRAHVYSGKTGKLLYSLPAVSNVTDYGVAITTLGDIDGDKIQDLAVMAARGQVSSTSVYGPIWLYSGKTGKEIRTILPTIVGAPAELLRSCPDIDGDKKRDVVIGFPSRRISNRYQGEVHIYSSGTGKLLTRAIARNSSIYRSFAESFDVLPDMDRDGAPELMVSDRLFSRGTASAGTIHRFSAKTGKLIESFGSRTQHRNRVSFARNIGFVGDLDKDGISDLYAYVSDNLSTYQGLEILAGLPLDLSADTSSVSIFKGGKSVLSIHAGSRHAKDLVMMLGTASGIHPGIQVGKDTLHLNADSYLTFTLSAPNAVFFNNLSLLDGKGQGKVGFTLPTGLPASLGGTILDHSCLFLGKGGLSFANTAVPLEIQLF